jgi:hypothetical protein
VKNLDTVKMSKTDFIRLALALPDTESFDDNTICAPELPSVLPLPYFKVLYDYEDKVDVDYLAVYVKPRYGAEISFDVYVDLHNDTMPIPIMEMNLITTDDGDKEFHYLCSSQFDEVAKSSLGSTFTEKYDEYTKWHTDRFAVYGHLYSIVQNLLLNRPELVLKNTVRSAPIVPVNQNHKHNHQKKRKVQTYRTITVNYEELEKFESSRPSREFSCLAWGVIGHWRNYKDGKRVWVNAYVKGKERDKAESYDSKEYVMQEPDLPLDTENKEE